MKNKLRAIPPIHELQGLSAFQQLIKNSGMEMNLGTKILKSVIDEVRKKILSDEWKGPEPGHVDFVTVILSMVEKSIQSQFSYTLQRVINATGTILHTNLGRARLSQTAVKHVMNIAENYSNLEYKLEEGERGSRHTHVEELVKQLTGAEAAMVVNNNAAAVYLILRALAKEKEVIVSRGQLVEIGGSFRVSSIMEESGAKLVEVGTTNKTHLYDYEQAISEETAMILKVHTSNFKVIGFTKTVETQDLAKLSAKHEDIIFYEDLGSGVLIDYQKYGIGDEPVVSDVLKMGADIVSFSGDKLLGGPQAGIIAGKKTLIDKLKKHQLARVLRVDKMTLAGMEGTLIDYLKGEEGAKNIPVVRNLLASKEEITERTKEFLLKLQELTDQFEMKVMDGFSQVGGGTMPDVEIPTVVAVLKHKSIPAEELSRKLRTENSPAIVVRIQKEEILIDLRTVAPEEELFLINALSKIK